jgi:hypothetical protein
MRFVFAHAILFSLLTTTGWSQAPFFPFEENGPFGVDGVGPFGDTEPVVWLPTGDFTSAYADNELKVSNTPFDGENPSLGTTIVLTSGPDDSEGNPTFPVVIADDLSVEARVRVNSAGTYASIFTRGQNPPPDGDGAAYFGRITGDGALGIANFADPSSFVSMPTGLDPINNDVILRVDTIGNTVTARARLADPLGPWSEPLSASFASRPPGVFGLGFGFDPNFETDPNFLGADAMATFRSVKAVPEPSTMCLVAFGILGAFGFRRRRPLD